MIQDLSKLAPKLHYILACSKATGIQALPGFSKKRSVSLKKGCQTDGVGSVGYRVLLKGL